MSPCRQAAETPACVKLADNDLPLDSVGLDFFRCQRVDLEIGRPQRHVDGVFDLVVMLIT
jgi:hypothetical protein